MLRGVLKAVDECSYVTKFGEKYIDKTELVRLLKLKEKAVAVPVFSLQALKKFAEEKQYEGSLSPELLIEWAEKEATRWCLQNE